MQYLFYFSSLTDVLKAKRVLSICGIKAKQIKRSAPQSGGCANALLVSESEYLAAVNCLRSSGTSYSVVVKQ